MTDEQLTLPLGTFVVPEQVEHLTLDERFARFHAANPWVSGALIALIEDAKAHGEQRVGIKALFERLRWTWARQAQGERWRLNNSLTSRYARHIAEVRPDLAEMLEMRKLRAA